MGWSKGILVFGFLMVGQIFSQNANQEEKAIKEILNAGGAVVREEKLPGRPVVGVDLTACTVSESCLRLLPVFTELRTLDM